ncbi:MAG TPA: hypothetical protein VGK17_05950 [Propionicimonas sp.]|jgi:hypothetical protein
MRTGVPFARVLFSGVLPVALAAVVLVSALLFLDDTGDHAGLGPAVSVVLASGLTAMILIETAKRLLPLSAVFNRRQVNLWLRDRSDGGREVQDELASALGVVPSEGHFSSPFTLPVEQLIAQLSLAVDRAMLQPDRFGWLLSAMVSTPTERVMVTYRDSHGDDPPWTLQPLDAHGEARQIGPAEMSSLVSSSLDRLQIYLSGRWRQYLRATSTWLAGAVALLIAWSGWMPTTIGPGIVVTALVLGGFVAWLARDLTAAVETWRR